MYPENNHPISNVDAESNCMINVARWFEEHLSTELEKDWNKICLEFSARNLLRLVFVHLQVF